jgi:hypothetical protein
VTLAEVAIQSWHAFIETASMVYCGTEIIVILVVIIVIIIIIIIIIINIITCYSDIKIISTYVQITINLSRITSNTMLEKDGEDQLHRSCDKRRSIT